MKQTNDSHPLCVHLQTLGCRLNEAELESWARDFARHGVSLTQNPGEANLLVVNSCAVTEEAAAKSRKLMRRNQRENPNARLVMTGCYASLDSAGLAEALGIDLLVANADKDRLVELSLKLLDAPTMPVLAMEPAEQGLLVRNRQRAFIKVQDGCRHRCTYCIVTLARGDERSRPIQSIIDELNQLHDGGIQEAVLAGVHLGGYGSDLGCNLADLVQAVLEKTSIPRLRLGSMEPWDLPEDFWDLFGNPRLMPHLHLPLQSGADSVLRRMSRRCSTDQFALLMAQARQAREDFNLTTDIIVGFPGETDEEWRQTLDFVRMAGFGHVHIFSYSPRTGTKAAGLAGQIDRNTKRQRVEQLHQLAEETALARMQGSVGKTHEILVEGTPSKDGALWLCEGYTGNYLKAVVKLADNPGNRIVRVRAIGVDEQTARLVCVAP